MEIIEKFVIPPSSNHVMLVKYILTISLLLFIPYVGMMLGATYISTNFRKKALKTGNTHYVRFAKDVIQKLTITKNAELALGTLPALSITFCYAQLLYEANTITISIMCLATTVLAIAFAFIYKYRTTFLVEDVLNSYRRLIGDKQLNSEDKDYRNVHDYEERISMLNNNWGRLGKYLLFSAVYLFFGCTALATTPYRWESVENILEVIFSLQTIWNFCFMLSLGGIMTGGAIIFFFFKWQGGVKNMDDEYASFVRGYASKILFVSSLCFPLFMFFGFLYMPEIARSPSVFVYLILTLLSLIILCNMIYSMIKNSDLKYGTAIFILAFVVIIFSILKDQSLLGNAVQPETLEATEVAEKMEKEAKLKLMTAGGINPELIYTQKCGACHKLDQKLIGPPHNLVVPKYNGDVKKLAEFIFNPQKIDPAYPPMPNQGLKKKEASAMAQYLIDKVSGKK